ncbi:hypothetical protein CEXT_506771 [Caerostris extrusa]|uniref:Uncharacterized protein n=1 Tax=Caerostris extrusa TaxID=172846 RepID=A0AAV4TI28_CAEEX|nr:hypothetical protein CEXT_506771 [Caerostris extrusa]
MPQPINNKIKARESFFVATRPGVEAGAGLRQASPVPQESTDGRPSLTDPPTFIFVFERQPRKGLTLLDKSCSMPAIAPRLPRSRSNHHRQSTSGSSSSLG